MADQPKKPTRVRKVKNPESFRDKAVKASTPKKSRFGKLRGIKKVFSLIARPFKKAHAKVSQSKFSKPFKKPLRILAKILLITYFRDSYKELKQVSWPSFKTSRKLTVAVLGFAIVFGAVIAGVDWVLGKIFKEILVK